jgi:hypothetical protein
VEAKINVKKEVRIEMLPKCLYAKTRINVSTPLDGQHQEELEDKIRDLLREYGVKARIRSLTTGNVMAT